MTTEALIQEQIQKHPVLLYMKGTPQKPMCGFSKRAAMILESYDISFTAIDVLANPEIRRTLPIVSNWPTFPQLYIKTHLIGGSDIIEQLHKAGELQTKLSEAAVS